MATPSHIGTQTVEGLIAAITADAPAPGCGSAAAVAVALAAACAGKAAQISLKHTSSTDLKSAVDQFNALARRALHTADEDAKAFEQLVTGQARDAETRVLAAGERLGAIIDALERILGAIEPAIHPTVAGDFAAALDLAAAARAIETRNCAEIKE